MTSGQAIARRDYQRRCAERARLGLRVEAAAGAEANRAFEERATRERPADAARLPPASFTLSSAASNVPSSESPVSTRRRTLAVRLPASGCTVCEAFPVPPVLDVFISIPRVAASADARPGAGRPELLGAAPDAGLRLKAPTAFEPAAVAAAAPAAMAAERFCARSAATTRDCGCDSTLAPAGSPLAWAANGFVVKAAAALAPPASRSGTATWA